MFDSFPARLALLCGLAAAFITFIARKLLYPKPYPGIPFNEASARRIAGDIPHLLSLVKKLDQYSEAIFLTTTQKLGTPIAQLLLPGVFPKPLIIVEDPREIEDILVRRNKEFDRAPFSVDLLKPMFPRASISQFSTRVLKAQKRLWMDTMSADFLRRLKASTVHRVQAFNIHDDLKNTTLDAIWMNMVGEQGDTVRYEITKLQNSIAGHVDAALPPPRGAFIKAQVGYIQGTLSTNVNSISPKWAQIFETFTPSYRSYQRIVTGEMTRAMEKAVARYKNLEIGALESDEIDTCAMDLIRQKDTAILQEPFTFLVAGYDSISNTLAFFFKFMEAHPFVQSELRSALKTAFPGSELPSAQEILSADIPYLDGALEETTRLAGAAKSSTRMAMVGTQILGCPIPKGAEVFLTLHLHRGPPVQVDEAKRSETSQAAVAKIGGDGLQGSAGRDLGSFEPRRRLVRDEKTGKETFNRHALSSLAFGGGYRGCFGLRKLAMMDLRIVIVLLILKFEFLELPDEYKPVVGMEKFLRCTKYPYAKLRAL
ncbi:cytochrome P450 3A24 [Podospora australis]|uniref:Cytochrome P450 3A24 n=1 Tax=Podospora australis TaxID=1536484 RepID=A0AAN7AJC0_9PEZI|nr:cytochrome P450 3A24 [Podospora australis]